MNPIFEAAAPPFVAAAHPYRWAILAGVWLLYTCFGLTVTSMAPLVQPITRELGISHAAMGGVLGAWPLVYIVAAVPSGALTDRLGPRRTLCLAMLLIALSAGLRGLAEGQFSLFLAVAVFGLGGPLVSIGAPKLVALWFAGKERGLAMGIYMTGPSLGAIAALSLTNSVLMPLVEGNWRLVMFLYAGLALAAALVWFAVSSHRVSREVERQIAAEPRGAQLQIFADLIRLRPVQFILVISVGMFFFNHGLNNWLPEILRVGGMDAKTAGFWASIPTAVGVAGALLIPRLATPPRRLAILAALLVSAGVASLLLHSTGVPLALGLVCQGIARSSMMTVAVLLLMETREVGARHTGSASGLFFSAGEIGGVLGPLTIGVLYDATGGFAMALYLLTAICAVLLLLLGLLRRASA